MSADLSMMDIITDEWDSFCDEHTVEVSLFAPRESLIDMASTAYMADEETERRMRAGARSVIEFTAKRNGVIS